MRPIFITGTDTGVGKTVLAGLLARFLISKNFRAAALKPICSGGRADACVLHAALNGALALDEINPWHFAAPIAPPFAARLEKKKITLAKVVAHIRAIQKKFPKLVIEGAGGLLSPMGENFDSRDLIQALDGLPIVVAPNRLGAIGQTLLVMEALPKKSAGSAKVVLMSQRSPDESAAGNIRFLRQKLGSERVLILPWLKNANPFDHVLQNPTVRNVLKSLTPA